MTRRQNLMEGNKGWSLVPKKRVIQPGKLTCCLGFTQMLQMRQMANAVEREPLGTHVGAYAIKALGSN